MKNANLETNKKSPELKSHQFIILLFEQSNLAPQLDWRCRYGFYPGRTFFCFNQHEKSTRNMVSSNGNVMASYVMVRERDVFISDKISDITKLGTCS